MNYINQFLFGIYPYICLAVFFVGSLIRFDRNQYSWKSESSELLFRGQLRLGSVLFHVGILLVFGGHIAGLLTPMWVFDMLGVSQEQHHIMALVAGSISGTMALAGIIILIHRRFRVDRLLITSTWRDKLVVVWLLLTILAGLSLIPFSLASSNAVGELEDMMQYAQRILTFRADAADYIARLSVAVKIHVFLGMSFFLIFPFTRMVHVWSGFAAFLGYIPRAWQLVRRRS
ncbi:respiratory nitrate reductase subunit gamma [Pasteurellaceae bacterium LIM206]|nr:respiratory nitrate reductase subunit gamma [Pasteurellaceae bacterium LIM206]